MKTALFAGDDMIPEWGIGGLEGFCVPTLSAYAIEFADFSLPPSMDYGFVPLTEASDFFTDGEQIRLAVPNPNPFLQMPGGVSRARLLIHYHGIRDYSLLLPQVQDELLKTRIALFYEEMEKNFDAGSWLSFALMAGAVFEGLLAWRLKKGRAVFGSFIEEAFKSELITEREKGTHWTPHV